MRAIRVCVLGVLVSAMCLVPANAQEPAGNTTSGRIVDFAFEPLEMTVDAGTTITWTNNGARPHTVTDRGGTFDTGPILPGATDDVTFATPGRYLFFCRINPRNMNAVLVVRAPAAEPAKTARVQALDPGREGETLRFDPPELSVQTGTALTFANVGGKPHTLTADDGSFDTGVVTPGAEGGRFAGSNATVVLDEPGTFPFHCEVHPVMTGVLTVTGQAREGPDLASAAPEEASVEAADFAFEPAEASVAPGGEVTWRNTGEVNHTATFDDLSELDTKVIAPGSSATLTAPDDPGSYSYHCDVHPARMRGVLVVVGQNQSDPTAVQAQGAPAAAGGGPGGGVSMLVLVTGVLGAFLGGFGVSALVRRPKGGG